MVSLGLAKRVGLLVLAAGLAFSGSVASQEPKAGNPAQHGIKDAIEADKQAANNQQTAKEPPAPQKPRSEPAPANQPTAKDGGGQHEDKGPAWTDMVQAVSALVVMGFTGFLAWLSWRQHVLEKKLASDTGESVEIARRSADAARRSAVAAVAAAKHQRVTSEIELRAYILPDVNRAKPPKEPGGEWLVTICFKNFGRTPAHNVSFKFTRSFGRPNMPLTVYVEPPLPIATILGVDCGLESRMTFNLKDDEAEALKDGSGKLIIGATATYADMFGGQRVTTFTMRCMADGTLTVQGDHDRYT